MADYEDGASGQVENESYCMKQSMQAKNVADMNAKMGYNDMSDLANTKPFPVAMNGAKRNEQLGESMPDGKNRGM